MLIDLELGKAVFLIDNHAPFGFHMHSSLPTDKDQRQSLNISTYEEAYKVFMEEVDKRAKEHKNKN